MSNMKFKIADKNVGEGCEPFIIAEMSGNHNHNIKRALQIIDEAKNAGASSIKLQTYTADTITMNCRKPDFFVNESDSLWSDENLYDLYQKAHTPWDWHGELFEYAKKRGIICFSSPFDTTAVDFLEKLNAPAYKIASFECVHIPLIKHAAKTGKPIIISTGLAEEDEIAEAVDAAKSAGNKNIMLLKCTSKYPALPEDANLVTIPEMSKRFGVPVGLSDHTMGVDVSRQAVKYYGAVAIEKHVTLAENEGGVDEAFSLKPSELKELVDVCQQAAKSPANPEDNKSSAAHGKVHYGGTEAEQPSKAYRASVYFKSSIKKGEVITEQHIRVCRPGFGLKPKYFDQILGKVAAKDAEFGDRVTWESVQNVNACSA